MIFQKMLTDEVQKLSANVCLYVHAVGWIKPNYISLSVLAAVLCVLCVTHTAQNSHKNRQRNIIWFNPPYSIHVQCISFELVPGKH